MSVRSTPQVVKPLPEEIATAAYYIWEKEGRANGRAADHWQRAEAQLMAAHACDKASDCKTSPPQNLAAAVTQSLRKSQQLKQTTSLPGRHRVVRITV
jgi:Protein of unknown function (DUF2934)